VKLYPLRPPLQSHPNTIRGLGLARPEINMAIVGSTVTCHKSKENKNPMKFQLNMKKT
jgi:hypothetical protein